MSDQNERHIDLLGTFHYVLGALTALFACLPFLHIFIGISLLSGEFLGEPIDGTPPPDEFAVIFIVMGLIAVALGWAMAIGMFVAGSKLRKRQSRTFCLVIAGLECLFFPFGTVLGVFTLVNLTQKSVIALFERPRQTAGSPAPVSR
ncbi:hypothetical protein GF420_08690 [candidate division GN15 bacterium]|nr:hypothetical protein [candidate division GN15 bacterium]